MSEVREALIGDGTLKVTSDGRAFTNRISNNFRTGEWHEIHPQDAPPLRYKSVVVNYQDGRREKARLHRLIAQCFVDNPNPDVFDEVNHIDGNKNNNHADNLEWTTHWGNMKHARDTGLIKFERHYCKWCGKEISMRNKKQMKLCPEHRKINHYYHDAAPNDEQEKVLKIAKSIGIDSSSISDITGVTIGSAQRWLSGRMRFQRIKLETLRIELERRMKCQSQ